MERDSAEARFDCKCKCKYGQDCRYFRAASVGYEVSEDILVHLQTFSHQRKACRYGGECRAFLRVQSGGYRPDDVMHLLVYHHPPRIGHTAVGVDAHAFVSAAPTKKKGVHMYGVGASERAQLTEYHECILGKNATVSIYDLVKEVTVQGFGQVLLIKGDPRHKTLQEKAAALESHPRNTGDTYQGDGRSGGRPARSAAILAVMIYTGTDVFSVFNSDKRRFYDRSHAARRVIPRFPVLDLLLIEARASLSSKWTREENVGSEYGGEFEGRVELWCGMHKAYISSEDRKRGRLTLAQDQSMSYDRNVAEFFLANQGACPQEGTLFHVLVKDKPVGAAGDFCFFWPTAESDSFADLSWISKFPDEQEVLVEAGLYLEISRIEVLATNPLVELVTATLNDDRAEPAYFA